MISAYFYLIDPPAGQPRYRPEQIMFGGDSAGGNLSVVTCSWLRDHPQNYPMPGGLLLISPWLDVSHSVPSFFGNGNHDYLPEGTKDPKYINDNRMHYFLPDNSRIYDPLISPIFDKENKEKPFPPTMVHNGDAERVRDDCIVWASINKSSNIQIEMYEDMVHVFQYLTLVDSMATLSLHRLGAFADSVWRKQPWRAHSNFMWVRRNRSLIPLTRPMAIMEYGRQVCIALGVWSDQKQSVYDGVIQPLIDEEEREALQPVAKQGYGARKLVTSAVPSENGPKRGDSISFDDWGFESQRGSYAPRDY